MAWFGWFRTEESDLELKLLHDLGNSLTCIKGYSQLLLSSRQSSDKDALKKIDFCSQQAIGLMQDLMDQESLKRGDLTLRRKPIILEELLSQVTDGYEVICRAKGIALKQRFHTSGTVVSADSRRIAQVLANLLSNAIRHTFSGGAITVAMLAQEDCAKITIQDTGEGIPLEQQRRIFDKFYQSGKNSGSMGLGLNICREIISRHGGQIGVTSAGSGRGSCFYFTLPLGAAAASEPPEGRNSSRVKSLVGAAGIIAASICFMTFRRDSSGVIAGRSQEPKPPTRSERRLPFQAPENRVAKRSSADRPSAHFYRPQNSEPPSSSRTAGADRKYAVDAAGREYDLSRGAGRPAVAIPMQDSLYSAEKVARAFGDARHEELVDSLAGARAGLESRVVRSGLQFDGSVMSAKTVATAVAAWKPIQTRKPVGYQTPLPEPQHVKQVADAPPIPDNIVLEPAPESRWTNPILLFAGGIGLAGALMFGSTLRLGRKSIASSPSERA